MIRTARLVLRPARPEDLGPLHEIFGDPEAMRYWSHPAHTDISQTQEFLDWFLKDDPATRYEFILERDGVCVGKAGVWEAPEIGYILARDHWGQGLVHEALAAILPGAFAAFPDHPALTAEIDPRNVASARVLGKLGFELVRYVPQSFLYGDTDLCDTAYYALPRPVAGAQGSADQDVAGVIR